MLCRRSPPLGLEVLNGLLRTWREPEAPKPVMRKSFWIALSRCSIHFPPMVVLGGLIYANYHVTYIGPGFMFNQDDALFLALFQVAAKTLELLCVASLSTIVLQALRHELLEDGVPIGLLGSGIWFAQISSFWSPGFLVSAPYSLKKLRRFRLYMIIVMAGAIAAVVGPAAAVLLLPRSQNVPAGGTSYFLNGTAEQFWPSTVDSSSELEVCSQPNATLYAVCPSGGYESLRLTLRNFNYSSFNSESRVGHFFDPLVQAKGYTTNNHWPWATFEIQSPLSLVPPVISSVQLRSARSKTSAVQPHAATVIRQQQLVRQWNSAAFAYPRIINSSPSEYKYVAQLLASGSTTNPWVRTRCAWARNLSADAEEAYFPYLYQSGDYTLWADDAGPRSWNITMLNRTESSHIRTQWMSLPIEVFGVRETGTVTSGLFLEMPWTYGSRIAIGCAVAAAWHTGGVSSDSSANNNGWSNDISGPAFGSWTDSPDASDTHKPIGLDVSWLNLLTPTSPGGPIDSGGWVPNTLERAFYNAGYHNIVNALRTRPQLIWDGETRKCYSKMNNPNKTDTDLWEDGSCGRGVKDDLKEFMIASIVVDGLSRHGSWRMFNIRPTLGDWTLQELPQTSDFQNTLLLGGEAVAMPSDPSLVVQHLDFQVAGYAYYASTTTDYLATAVAVVYILLALAHTAWALGHRISSSAWDSITELLVLCQNSPPSAPLNNTSTGIHRLATYTKTVKIRATDSNDQHGESRLVLVLEDGFHIMEDAERSSSVRSCDNAKSTRATVTHDWVSEEPALGKGAVSALVSAVPIATLGDLSACGRLRRRILSKVQIDKKYS